MTRKLLEAFFRHKLLVLLPTILIPSIVAPIALLTTPAYFLTSVGVWVDRPTYLDYKDGSSPWITPAQYQVGRLGELLRTRAFQVDVAQRTSLASLVGTPANEARLFDLFGRGASVGAAGDNVMVVQFQAPTAQVSYEVAQALVSAYQEKMAADQADQSGAAVQFYQSRVEQAQQQLARTSQDLRRYVAAHQDSISGAISAGTDPGSMQPLVPAALLDPKLATLQSGVQSAQTDVNNAQSSLTQAQRDASAAMQGQQLRFQVLDPAQLPTAPTRQVKKMITYPIAGFVVGLALSGVLLVLLVATDRSVRSETDLGSGMRVVGTLPTLKLKRVPKQLRPVATRRAIGAVAGTALPAAGGAK